MIQQIYSKILTNSSIWQGKACYSRRARETFYDILNVQKNCSNKEIKDSFIQLSKTHHPDKTSSKALQKRFVQINEAYNVLSKPLTRKNYDFDLQHQELSKTQAQHYHNTWEGGIFYGNGAKPKNNGYYGVKGIKKVSNGIILLICIGFCSFGTIVQYFAITKSFTFQREKLIQKSLEAEKNLMDTYEVANKNGNDIQLEILKMKFGSRLERSQEKDD